MGVSIDVKVDGKVTESIDLDTRGKKNPFSTGSIGFHGNGKVAVGDKVHQANFLLTEVGTKGLYKK